MPHAMYAARPTAGSPRARAPARTRRATTSTPRPLPVGRLLGAWARRSPRAAGLLQVLEELGARIEHHDVALVPERGLVRFEAAVERVELRVLSVGGSVDRGCLGVAFTLGLLRLLVGIGEYHFALAIRVGTYPFRLRRALRAQFVGY